MLCSFTVNGVVFSIINTFGIIFVELKDNLEAAGDEDAAFKCSLVGSLAIGSTFFLSFLAGVLTDRVGLRTTAMTGALLATLGLALSATYHDNINVLYFTYGVMFGTGASLIYTPSLSVLGRQTLSVPCCESHLVRFVLQETPRRRQWVRGCWQLRLHLPPELPQPSLPQQLRGDVH